CQSCMATMYVIFFFSSRRRHTRSKRDWSSDVCSSDLVMSVAREAGERSKISVYAKNTDVDAVGSCVGARGARVEAIVDELNGEKIDIVLWDEDPKVFVKNALSPSQVVSVNVDEENKYTVVVVP